MWENVIDDMNTTKIWAIGGMVWNSKKKAQACINNLKHPAYGFESGNRRFSIVELTPTPITNEDNLK